MSTSYQMALEAARRAATQSNIKKLAPKTGNNTSAQMAMQAGAKANATTAVKATPNPVRKPNIAWQAPTTSTASTAYKAAVAPAAQKAAVTPAVSSPAVSSPVAQQTPAAVPPSAAQITSQYNLQPKNEAMMSFDEYRNKLVEAVKGGILAEYEANASVIKNNLSRALSDLQAEQDALNPLYQQQLKAIGERKFTTEQQQRELMNQAGWNATNSGLAVGEYTRIDNQASEETNEATSQYNQYMADIQRRQTLAKDTNAEELTALEKYKNNKLSGAEADALVQSENRYRDIFESDRAYNLQQAGFEESVRQFQENHNFDLKKFEESVRQYDQNFSLQSQQFQEDIRRWNSEYALNQAKFNESARQFSASLNARTATQKAQDAKEASGFSDTQIDNLTTAAISDILGSGDQSARFDSIMKNPEIPTKVKQNVLNMLQGVKDYKTEKTGGALSFITN